MFASNIEENTTPSRLSKWIKRIIRWTFIGFVCWLIVRSFVFQTMYIPSNSMLGTLQEGDYIYVNKLAYGPRIPITLLSIPISSSGKYLDWIQLPYYRLPGYDEVQLNDVIVFNLPTDTAEPIDCRTLYIKRCVGLPGDSLQITRGDIFINGKLIAPNEPRPIRNGDDIRLGKLAFSVYFAEKK